VFATFGLGIFVIVHSLFVSSVPDVSILKGVLWVVVAATLIAAWGGLAEEDRSRLEAEVIAGLGGILIASLPLLPTDLGYLRNGSGFQGVLNHPQAFGLAMAVLGAWLGARVLERERPTLLDAIVLGIAMVSVILSESRTAGAALVGGTMVAVLGVAIATRRRPTSVAPALASSRAQLVILLAVAGLVIVGPELAARLQAYVSKRSDERTMFEAYDSSRGHLVRSMWDNILEHPIEGIGFGIASDVGSMEVLRDEVTRLPTGASIEKGVMPLAVLEELGILGALFTGAWLIACFSRAFAGGLVPVAVMCTVLGTNLGESTLFSPSGMGMLILIALAWSVTSPRQRRRVGAGCRGSYVFKPGRAAGV
jgi:O-antigen ligase